MHTKKPPPEPMTASQLLTGAAAWIDGHGWIQNTYYEPGTLAACAIGALHFASQDRYGRDGQARRAAIAEAAGSLAQIAEELNGRPLDGATAQEQVIAWNNSGVIDQADAVVWLQKSAARAAEMVR